MRAVIVEGKGQFGGNFGRPLVTNEDFATRLFPNYSGQLIFSGWYPLLVLLSQTDRCSGSDVG